MLFLRSEIEKFIEKSKRNNFYIAKWSLPTIWGGSTLLKMHLRVMEEIIQFKKIGLWDWDFILNLSESEFPIKFVYMRNFFLNF